MDDKQFSFCSRRSAIDAIFRMRQMQDTFNEKKTKLLHIFVDWKSYWVGPKEAKSTRKLVTAVLSLNMESKSRVKAMVGKS